MPNLCCNDIRVSGPSDAIDAFLLAAESVEEDATDFCPLSLERLLPPPPELLAGDGGRDWCILNWGTKWDLFDNSLYDPSPDPREILPEDCREILVQCASAWSPPLQALRSISRLYPSLTFEIAYDEPGEDFAGVSLFRAGHGGGGRGRSWFRRQEFEDNGDLADSDTADGHDGREDIVFTFTLDAIGPLTSDSGLLGTVRETLAVLMSHSRSDIAQVRPHLSGTGPAVDNRDD